MDRLGRSTLLRDHIFGDFLLGRVAGAVGSHGGDGGSVVDVFLVGATGIMVEGFDDIIRVDLGRI